MEPDTDQPTTPEVELQPQEDVIEIPTGIIYHYKDLVKIIGESFYEWQTGMVVNAIKIENGYKYSVIFMWGAAQEMFDVDQLELQDPKEVVKSNARRLDPLRNFFSKF